MVKNKLVKNDPQPALKTKQFINISDRFSYFFLLLIIALVYCQSLTFKFTYFDDDSIIIRNEMFLKDISNIKYSFTRDSEFQVKSNELYRPLQNFSFFIDSYIFGVKPFGQVLVLLAQGFTYAAEVEAGYPLPYIPPK